MSDLKIILTPDGGDFEMVGPDIRVIEGFQNMPLLGLFGGNVEESTRDYRDAEQRLDWWGNSLFMANDSSIQFNSDLERLLRNIALTSESRLQIEQIVKRDLKFMLEFSTLDVVVSFVSVDQIEINIKIQEPGNLESTNFIYIWDSLKTELINKSL